MINSRNLIYTNILDLTSSLRSLMKLTKYTMLMLTRHSNEGPTRTTIGSFVEVSLKVPV